MNKLIIDADGATFGRLCSFAAKRALEGNEIIIVNSEKTIITGNKKELIKKYIELKEKGNSSLKGPKFSKAPHRLLKKGIKGMVPDFRRGIGKQAISRIKCYEGIPKEFENERLVKSKKSKPKRYIALKELAERI